MPRRLAHTVHVTLAGGARRSFLAGHEVSDEDAVLITNPRAWEDGDDASPAEDAGPAESSGDSAGPPAKAASKAEWVDYAVSQGAFRFSAEAMTKADLVAEFGD